MADLRTRQVGVYVQLPNRDGSLVAGQFATGRIVGEQVEGALVVPVAAVRGSGAQSFVLVVEDGRIARRPVQTGLRDDLSGLIAIQSGVSEGEQVIATPVAAIEPGTAVRVVGGGAVAKAAAGGEG